MTEALQELKAKVHEIPIGGWWKHASEEVFIATGKNLIDRGFTVDEAIQVLSILYFAVRNEFGD